MVEGNQFQDVNNHSLLWNCARNSFHRDKRVKNENEIIQFLIFVIRLSTRKLSTGK